MRRKLFSIVLSICMVFTMIPIAGGGVFAATATSVKIGGVVLDSNNKYYHNGDNGAPGTANDIETEANAEFDAIKGTLTLNGLNVNSDNGGIRWENEYGGSGFKDLDLTIILAGNSNNTIVNTDGSGIVGTTGGTNVGPSLTIKGTGVLNVTGSNSGIWVWKNITIGDSAVVEIKANKGGIYNNSSNGKITIKDNANVAIDSNGYGIGYDNGDGNRNTPVINGGTLTVKGTTAAMMVAPSFDNEREYGITASVNKTGESPTAYNKIDILRYKYLEITSNPAATEEVGIYLRTIGKDSPDNGENAIIIKLSKTQLAALGLTDYYWEHWVNYGSFQSAYAATILDHEKQNRDSDGVKAVIDEINSDKITKKEGITFSSLDKVTWDTLSWSQNSSGPNTWHLNGEVRLCKIEFDLNGGTGDSPAQYAVYDTNLKTGWPANPTRNGYTFAGWYTDANNGTEITDTYEFTKNETVYAHWIPISGTLYSVTVNAGTGMSTTGNVSQTVTAGEAMTDIAYTADDGYYFPAAYHVETVNGISVTRNSYTQITVSGTPTASAGITLPAATAKTKAETPQADFVATGNNSGKLTNVDSGMKYRIDNDAWTDITGSEIELNNLGACTIEVVKKGGETTLDSNEQTITVTKAAEPSLTAMQPIEGRDKGSIETTTAHEISKDSGNTYEACTVGKTSLEPGTYYIRVKASGAVLASDAQEIVINNPAEYTITFDANGGYFDNDENKKPIKFKSGKTITAPENPSKSSKMYIYTFDGWYTDQVEGTRLNDNDTARADVTYYAHWIETPREYNITYNADGGTINEDYNETYTYKTRIINFPTKVTRAGYTFEGWSSTKGSGTLLENWPVTEENLGDLTFYALWTPIDAVQPKVSINPAATAINCGDTADITVTAEADTDAEYKLTYQWYESTDRSNAKGTLIVGATGNTYTVPADKEAGTYYYFCEVKATRTDNSKFVSVKSDVATVTVTKKSSGSHYKPVQKPVIEAGDGCKTELGSDGTKVTITVEEGYELVDVLVNGISKGKVTELTGLKTGDKVEIKTEKIPEKLEPQAVKDLVKELKLVARSERLSNGNVRIKVTKITDINDNPVDLNELEKNGYTVKFKYYRSVKKSAGYDTRLEKDADINSYINNFGDKGTKYYYKVKVMVYDADGNLVAQSSLNQCKYAMRVWIK